MDLYSKWHRYWPVNMTAHVALDNFVELVPHDRVSMPFIPSLVAAFCLRDFRIPGTKRVLDAISNSHKCLISAATAMMKKMIKRMSAGIQIGERTHNQDHLITPVNFRTMNAIASNPPKLIPLPEYDFDSLIDRMGVLNR